MSITRGNTELVNVFTGRPINLNAPNSFSEGFPLGEAWLKLVLRLNLAIIIGTGTGPISEGELNILKGLTFKTSMAEIGYNAVPGRPLYRLAQVKEGSAPPKDAIAAADGTYRVQYHIWFVDPRMIRPEDFLLDSKRYNRVQLDLNVGGLADLFTTPGTATLTVTADLYIERIRGILPKEISPVEYSEIFIPPPVNPTSQNYVDIERSNDLAIKRLLICAQNSAVLGTPFSGVPADTTIDKIGFDTDRGELFNKVPWRMLNTQNKQDYQLEAAIVGVTIIDFIKDGSKMSAVSGGGFSRFRIFFDNGTLSNSQISIAVEGFRPLKRV